VIRAAGKTALGVPLLYLGLAGENVTRLVAGEPIKISASYLAKLGLPPMEVWIVYGRTEDALLAELDEHGITTGARVTDERPSGGSGGADRA
jgi:hypothetical protein